MSAFTHMADRLSHVSQTRRPYINPPVDHADQKMGEGHVKQRMRQFPVYDEDLDYCGSIKTAEESKMAEIFLNDRKTRRGKGEKRQFEALIDQWVSLHGFNLGTGNFSGICDQAHICIRKWREK